MTTTAHERAEEYLTTLDDLIERLRSTEEQDWQTQTCRSDDGRRNCLLGQLFRIGEEAGDEDYSNALVEVFEDRWSTSFQYFPINDGTNPRYPQDSARDRVVAFLEALRDARELRTFDSMDLDYARSLTAEAVREGQHLSGPVPLRGWMISFAGDIDEGEPQARWIAGTGSLAGYEPRLQVTSWPAGRAHPSADEPVEARIVLG